MINWPREIIEDLARRRCVLFLGSGVSANSKNAAGVHPKTWRKFLEEGINRIEMKSRKEIIKQHIRNRNYLMACELLRKFLGNNDFNRLLNDEFLTPQFLSADIHKDIFQLDTRIVVTPNFDKIYDGYASNESHNTVAIKNYYDPDVARSLRENQRVILKMHGTIDTPDRLIFTQMDYAKARNLQSNFYLLLNALLLTQSFLFIGAGLDDPDIKLLLENYSYQFQYSNSHYFVIPKEIYNSNELAAYEEIYKLKFLKYSNADEHKELKDSVRELVKSVNDMRATLAANLSW